MLNNVGFHMGMWCQITEKEGALQFPRYGTFNLKILDNLKRMLYELKAPTQMTHLEALDAWPCALHAKEKEKFQVKTRRRISSWIERKQEEDRMTWREETLWSENIPRTYKRDKEERGRKG